MPDTHAPTPAPRYRRAPDACLFANRAPAAERRFAALSALFDPRPGAAHLGVGPPIPPGLTAATQTDRK
jgi:hypothetical protein